MKNKQVLIYLGGALFLGAVTFFVYDFFKKPSTKIATDVTPTNNSSTSTTPTKETNTTPTKPDLADDVKSKIDSYIQTLGFSLSKPI